MRVKGEYGHDHHRWYFTCCRRRMQVDVEVIERMGMSWFLRKVDRFARYARSQARRAA
jgi:hypothetical protein